MAPSERGTSTARRTPRRSWSSSGMTSSAGATSTRPSAGQPLPTTTGPGRSGRCGEASSRAAIGAVFRIRVLPVMGSRPLSAVKRADIEAWAQRLPLSPSSVATARQYLGTMFLAAVEDGLLARNPCKGARLPKVEKAPVVPLTADEVHRLEDAAPPLLRAAIVLGAGTGLRQGEVTGLTLDRVAFLQRSVRVDRQLVTPPTGAPYLGPPKTAASYPQRPAAGSRPRGTGRAGAEVR